MTELVTPAPDRKAPIPRENPAHANGPLREKGEHDSARGHSSGDSGRVPKWPSGCLRSASERRLLATHAPLPPSPPPPAPVGVRVGPLERPRLLIGRPPSASEAESGAQLPW